MKTWINHMRRGVHENFDVLLSGALSGAAEAGQIDDGNNRGPLDHSRINAFTVVIIEDENRRPISKGYAFCSNLDQFNRKRGRQIAQGRAVKMARQKGVEVGTLVT